MNPASFGYRMVFNSEAVVTWLPPLQLSEAFVLLILPSAPLRKRNHSSFRTSLRSRHCGSPAVSEREKLPRLQKERSFVSSVAAEGKKLPIPDVAEGNLFRYSICGRKITSSLWLPECFRLSTHQSFYHCGRRKAFDIRRCRREKLPMSDPCIFFRRPIFHPWLL